MNLIDRNNVEKYSNEYDVKIRRLKDFFSITSELKEQMAGALVEFQPGETIREHVNKENVEEVFLLLDGTADFVLEGEVIPMSAGDISFAPVGQRHYFTNTSDSTSRIFCIWWKVHNT